MEYKFFNRELSWLSFNHRVLQEAKDPATPLYEKIKFLAIFSSNLDEFFRVRVASLRSLLDLKKKTQKELKFDVEKLLEKLHKTVVKMQEEYGKTFADIIRPELEQNNIYLVDHTQLNIVQKEFISELFNSQVVPHIMPMIIAKKKICKGVPLLFELGLPGSNRLVRPLLLERTGNLRVLGLRLRDRSRRRELARIREKFLAFGRTALRNGRGCGMNRLPGFRKFLEAESDQPVKKRVEKFVTDFRYVVVEIHSGTEARVLERIGVAGGRLVINAEANRQPLDLRIEKKGLSFVRKQELDEGLCGVAVLRSGNDADIRRNDRRNGRIDELDRKARCLGGQPEEIDDDADAVLAGIDRIRNSEAPIRDRREIAADLQKACPALVPAFALEDRFNGQVRRAGPGWGGYPYMSEKLRLLQVVPFLRNRQAIRTHVTRIVHDAVAGCGEAEIESLRVVHGRGADAFGDAGCGRLVFLQETPLLQHFEGIRRGRPEHVGRVGSRFANK